MATPSSYAALVPTPDRTSLPEIVAAGRHLLEAGEVGSVTMAAVAARVGVRAPSLYKRLRNRDELLGLIGQDVAAELTARLEAAGHGAGDARTRLQDLLVALRTFARERPSAFRLLFPQLGGGVPLPLDLLQATSAPLFAVVTELAGAEHALEAARTVTAWATGFIGMELSGGFRLGGDVDAAFDFGLARLADAIAAR